MTSLTPHSQKLLHLLRTAKTDPICSAELLELVGSALLRELPRHCFPIFTDSHLFFACQALTAEMVQIHGMPHALKKCYALTIHNRDPQSYRGGDPRLLESYDRKATAEIQSLLGMSEQALSGIVLAHKLLGQVAGTAESFQYSVDDPSPFDWPDRREDKAPAEPNSESSETQPCR